MMIASPLMTHSPALSLPRDCMRQCMRPPAHPTRRQALTEAKATAALQWLRQTATEVPPLAALFGSLAGSARVRRRNGEPEAGRRRADGVTQMGFADSGVLRGRVAGLTRLQEMAVLKAELALHREMRSVAAAELCKV